jgi:Inner membrane component of T3SS, periplasmic domain
VAARQSKGAGRRFVWALPALVACGVALGFAGDALYKRVTGMTAPSSKAMPGANLLPRGDAIRANTERAEIVSADPANMSLPVARDGAPAATVKVPGPQARSPAAAPALANLSAQGGGQPAPRPTVAPPPQAISDDAEVAVLKQRIASAGLDRALRVERREGTIVVDGTVGSDGYGRWREVKDAAAKEAAGPGQRAITDLVKTSTAASLQNNTIASVVLGKAPYVLSANGRRASVGELLEDGWLVESISAQTVTLRRGQTVNRINPADGFPK